MQEQEFPSGALERVVMNDFEKIWNYENLYNAHCAARKGNRLSKAVIEFEMNLAFNMTKLSDMIRNKTYKIGGYYVFQIFDPKQRTIHALNYCDRVVQHCICDEVLMPLIDKKLIYDNAACRQGKGTHFALNRVTHFLREHYKQYGDEGYFLKCDIRKFFDSIDHEILKFKLREIIDDEDLLWLLFEIVDSYEASPGKGLPLGNQTSQWFAVYYLDDFDRLIKNDLKIRYYSRYMDDCVMIHPDKEYLVSCRKKLTEYLRENHKLEFNEKTQTAPIRQGVQYLGFHFYLTETGKVIRKIRQATKYKYKRKLKSMRKQFREGKIGMEEINRITNSYNAHLKYGHTYHLRRHIMSKLSFCRNDSNT